MNLIFDLDTLLFIDEELVNEGGSWGVDRVVGEVNGSHICWNVFF